MDARLLNLGFSQRYLQEASLYPEFFIGRIISQSKDCYKVATVEAEVMAQISGKMRYSKDIQTDYPAVGDFVMLDRNDNLHGNAVIHVILGRKSLLVRKAAGGSHDIQAIAANMDILFICMSLNKDYNMRRLERYLSIAWNSGATPVVVLTKSDLSVNLERAIFETEKVAMGADVVAASNELDDGYMSLLKYISPGITVAFVGSSGVGKSTLINRLLGENQIKTIPIRKDDKGKHTTTSRELILLPGGGAVIDTPGMREIGVEYADINTTFEDIDEMAQRCRFKDCGHENEPGCAVRNAILEGTLDEERLLSYKKLKKEIKYDGLNSRQIEKEKNEEMFSAFGGIKNARNFVKSKNKL